MHVGLIIPSIQKHPTVDVFDNWVVRAEGHEFNAHVQQNENIYSCIYLFNNPLHWVTAAQKPISTHL